MPISRITTWGNRMKLIHSALNGEFDNIVNYINAGLSGTDLAYPFTHAGNVDYDGNSILNLGQYAKVRVVLPGTNIQDKVDELESSEGSGIIQLVPGTYSSDASGISLPSGISLVGPGPEACTVQSTVAGSVITVEDSVSTVRSQTISGFKLNAQTGNTKGINVTALGGSLPHQRVRISNVEIDGNSVTAFIGCDIAANCTNTFLVDCYVISCPTGVRATSTKNTQIIRGHYENTTNVELVSCTAPKILSGIHKASTYNISMDRCTSFHIDGNTFESLTVTYDIYAISNSTTDSTNNLAGRVEHNHASSAGVNFCFAEGLRGTVFRGNFIDDTYSGDAVDFGAESKANTWDVNWCEETPWSDATVFDHLAYAVEMLEEARPLGGGAGTNPATPVLRLPTYTATPDTTSWGTDERGRVWITDDGAGTEKIEYWTCSAVTALSFV